LGLIPLQIWFRDSASSHKKLIVRKRELVWKIVEGDLAKKKVFSSVKGKVLNFIYHFDAMPSGRCSRPY
jgi:hypothetical protein